MKTYSFSPHSKLKFKIIFNLFEFWQQVIFHEYNYFFSLFFQTYEMIRGELEMLDLSLSFGYVHLRIILKVEFNLKNEIPKEQYKTCGWSLNQNRTDYTAYFSWEVRSFTKTYDKWVGGIFICLNLGLQIVIT